MMDVPKCSVCGNDAVYRVVEFDPEEGNMTCEAHKNMWYLCTLVRLENDWQDNA